MKVVFILPGAGVRPIGGFKVVYEYANGLVSKGHHVIVIHPAMLDADTPFRDYPKKIIRYLQRRIDRSYFPKDWFTVDPRVVMEWVPSLHQRFIPNADAVVATAWQTAEWVANYPYGNGKKYYLLQHWENWGNVSEERLTNTWRLPLNKIVISRWLEKKAESLCEKALYIPNGLNFNAFGVDKPIDARVPASVMMLHHEQEWKGSADGLAALMYVKQQIPNLTVTLFGVSKRPVLPDWIDYYSNPEQSKLRQLYNEASIFLTPSWSEGWGLPASEAMMCGDAVVATDIGGHREFCINEVTSLLSSPRNPEALANNILRLIEDQSLRVSLAHGGHQHIQQFTWEKAVESFEATLLRNVNIEVR